MFRQVGIIAALAALLVATMALPALAQNPHFVEEPTVVDKSLESGLSVTGVVAGLGQFSEGTAFLTAENVVLELQCVNPGGKIAPGQGTETSTVTGPTTDITPSSGN